MKVIFRQLDLALTSGGHLVETYEILCGDIVAAPSGPDVVDETVAGHYIAAPNVFGNLSWTE